MNICFFFLFVIYDSLKQLNALYQMHLFTHTHAHAHTHMYIYVYIYIYIVTLSNTLSNRLNKNIISMFSDLDPLSYRSNEHFFMQLSLLAFYLLLLYIYIYI